MMQLRNTSATYGAISLFLHWLMAILILLMFGLAWVRDFAANDLRMPILELHKNIGILILSLFVVRLIWRLINIIPALPSHYSRFIHVGAKLGHFSLYTLLCLLPLSGWIMVSAMGRPPVFFGLIMPSLITKNIDIIPMLKEIHETLAYGFIVLITTHISAALWHYFIKKDDILERMLPFIKVRKKI